MMIPAPWAAGGALLLSVAAFGAGWQVNDWRHTAAELKAVKKQNKAEAEARAKVDARAVGYEADRAAIQQQASTNRTIIKEVYRNVEVPADCEPHADALRVLDNAIGQSGNSRQSAPAVPSG